MKERLLITGGTGFLAYHIIEEAIRQGFEVFVSIRPGSSTVHLKHFEIQYTVINFADTNAIVNELEEKQYQYIIHAAGTTKARNQEEYTLVNTTFTHKLAIASVTANIALKKFVFISSLAAIGPALSHESDVAKPSPIPVTAYGKSKLQAENLLNEMKGLPLITFRPTAVYGPREKDMLIIFKTFNSGWEPYMGKGPQCLSFVYVKDLANLLINALRSDISNKTYNISDGNKYDRFALALYAKEALQKKTIKFFMPIGIVKLLASLLEISGRISGKAPALNKEKIKEITASWACNITDAKTDLKFQPKYNLEKGMKETMQWYKAEKWM